MDGDDRDKADSVRHWSVYRSLCKLGLTAENALALPGISDGSALLHAFVHACRV